MCWRVRVLSVRFNSIPVNTAHHQEVQPRRVPDTCEARILIAIQNDMSASLGQPLLPDSTNAAKMESWKRTIFFVTFVNCAGSSL